MSDVQIPVGYSASDDFARQDFERIHRWLSGTYWSPGISRERVEQGARNSTVVVGVFAASGEQAAFARAVSDTTRFGYIADVYVDDAHRKKGLARFMVQYLMNHPRVSEVSSWYLHTLDAQSVYAGLGFKVYEYPDRFMVWRRSKPHSH